MDVGRTGVLVATTRGVSVGVGVNDGIIVGASSTVAVTVGLGVGVEVGVSEATAVELAAGVLVAVGAGVSVSVADTSRIEVGVSAGIRAANGRHAPVIANTVPPPIRKRASATIAPTTYGDNAPSLRGAETEGPGSISWTSVAARRSGGEA